MSLVVSMAGALAILTGTSCSKSSTQEGDGGSGGEASGGGGGVASGGAGKGGGSAATGGAAGSASGGNGGSATGGAGGSAGQAGGAAGAAMVGAGGAMATGGAPVQVAVDYYVYASGGNEIQGFKFNSDTGALTSIGAVPSGSNTSYLTHHPKGTNVYATDEAGTGMVRAFAINATTGKLTAQSSKATGGTGAVHVSVHPSGKWLFVSNYSGANVSVFH
jgi:hypothetical protein